MDPYEVLGVSRSATADEVRAAFRSKARAHHPDRNPNDSDAQRRFQEVNAAFQLLSDPEKRELFDRYGSDGPSRASRGGPSFNVEDLFSDLFGRRSRQTSNAVVIDVQRTIELTFEESARGCTKSVAYERLDHCARCEGSGSSPGSQLVICSVCRGAGQVAVAVGFFGAAAAAPCPQCAGRGKNPAVPCDNCHGKGLEPKRRTVDVTVPPGIESDALQRVPGGPPLGWLRQAQYQRNPARYHLMTVAGLTMIKASLQLVQWRDSSTQRFRSVLLNRGLLTERWSTPSW